MHLYKALYRKWRPRTFDEVCGQEHITTVLKNQVASGAVSHAYLFSGVHGTGKTTCAKILAKAVNCLSPVDGNPCGKCAACLSIDGGTATDVLEIDAASNNGVDGIRAIRDEVVYPPSVLKKRVYIIDEFHMLTDSANNALLKTLEEPPEYVLFVLATTELHKIPATILSRCQRFDFRRIAAEVIAARLAQVCQSEKIETDEESIHLIARLADGAMRDALSMLDSCASVSESGKTDYAAVEKQLGISNNDEVVSLLSYAAEGEVSAAMEVLDRLYKNSRDLAVLIEQLAYLTRDLLVLQSLPGIGLDRLGSSFCFDKAMFESLRALSKTVTKEQLLYFFDVLSEAKARLSLSAESKRLAAEMAVIKLSRPAFSVGVPALEARVAALEAGFTARKAEPSTAAAASPESKAPPARQSDAPTPRQSQTPAASGTKQGREKAKQGATETAAAAPPPAQTASETPPKAQNFAYKAEFLDELLRRGAASIYAFASGCAYTTEGGTLRIEPDSAAAYSVLSTDAALQFLKDAAKAASSSIVEVVVRKYKPAKGAPEISLDDLI